MFDIEIIERKGVKVIDSKLLHKQLEVKSYHADWIRRRIDNYGFVEKKDFYIDHLSTIRGGTKRKVYLMTVDMCKHMAMIENNHTGEKVRNYFIDIEKEYYKTKLVIDVSKEVRKSLTDAVQEYGENERMHGHGFSTYTLMVYKLLGIKDQYKSWKKTAKKTDDFRLTLEPDLRKRVATVESMVKALLELGNEYAEIQATIEPLFKKKEIG